MERYKSSNATTYDEGIPRPILTRILNLARSADVIYKGTADGYTKVNQTLKDKVASVLAHPIPM